ncbi:sigma 54-interacting transcriptional regulator [Ferviditalea candida]|uniref:Sigma 54-interacting transcriptional regulator n=1 Tax=Ferviditalea candida TaxID=3108399 RepID=A0ABU5ZN24_9BACL|nr:sigma 54-interacting transcriptional regulator [Paenibacillaceae bacterium T2]
MEMPILLLGESGTGMELFAQSIHSSSSRSRHPFIAVNCSAIPESLVESELFGYEKGSFTGANRDGGKGKFEAANLGTIFLDEIGDMSLHVQAVFITGYKGFKCSFLPFANVTILLKSPSIC